MRLAGRCFCGAIEAWMARNPDEHLRCWGLRWCGVCGEAAAYRVECPACRRRRHNRYIQERMARDPEFKAKHRKASREWAAAQRRGEQPAYQREKEHKRRRYANDPEYAESKRASWRRRYGKVAA